MIFGAANIARMALHLGSSVSSTGESEPPPPRSHDDVELIVSLFGGDQTSGNLNTTKISYTA